MNAHQIQGLATALLTDYDLYTKGWRFDWDNGKRRLGACHYSAKRITMSRHLVANCDDAEIRETLLHEIAHALTPGHHHDDVWRAKLISMGGTGARTHQVETIKGRYDLVCANCGVVGNRHQAQGTWKRNVGAPSPISYYTHRKCGGKMWLVDTKAAVVAVQVPVHATPAQIKLALAAPAPAANPGLVCHCGCNGTTKGGAYLPGHDARHVSEVFAGWLANRHDLDGAKHLLRHAPKLQAKLEARIAAYAAKHYQ